jgi:hypothetical protein
MTELNTANSQPMSSIALTSPLLIKFSKTTSDPQTHTTRFMGWRETVKWHRLNADFSHTVCNSFDPRRPQIMCVGNHTFHELGAHTPT